MARLASQSDLERQRALLWQVVEDISGDLDLEPLLDRIVAGACTLIGAEDGVIGLYDPAVDAIRTAANYHIPESQVTAVLPRGWGLLGRVLELGAPVHCRYGDLPRPTRPQALDMDMIGMPIRIRGELIGVFGIGGSPPIQFNDMARDFLEHFARYAAFAIDNAKRHVLEQRRSARFSMIVRVAGIISSSQDIDTILQRAADAIHELLGYPCVDIPLVDLEQPETMLVTIRGGEHRDLPHNRLYFNRGVVGAAAREKKTQLVNDVSIDSRYVQPLGDKTWRTELATPIMLGEEVLGVINVESQTPFDDLDVQGLEAVAEHLAVAIQNARLSDQSRQLAVLEERQRLARELHDSITQILSSIGMISQSLEDSWHRSPVEGAVRTARLGQLAQMGFLELRELLDELSPVGSAGHIPGLPARQESVSIVHLHEAGLPATAEQMISAMLPAHVSHRTDFSGYRPQALEHEKALLRICQESASNAVRHAGASHLQIEAGVEDDHVWLCISDDGDGFCASSKPGMGLSNMSHRLLALGGAFHMAARLPTGIRMEARLPRQDRTT